MAQQILLIAAEDVSAHVAEALRTELDCSLDVAANRRAGMALLRRGEYVLVLLDESIAMADEVATDGLYQNAGAAPVLELNFGIAGVPRVVRQVKSALARRAQDQQQARAAAVATLQSELNSSLSGLLLEAELALREAQPAQVAKLRHVVELAGELRNRLRSA